MVLPQLLGASTAQGGAILAGFMPRARGSMGEDQTIPAPTESFSLHAPGGAENGRGKPAIEPWTR